MDLTLKLRFSRIDNPGWKYEPMDIFTSIAVTLLKRWKVKEISPVDVEIYVDGVHRPDLPEGGRFEMHQVVH